VVILHFSAVFVECCCRRSCKHGSRARFLCVSSTLLSSRNMNAECSVRLCGAAPRLARDLGQLVRKLSGCQTHTLKLRCNLIARAVVAYRHTRWLYGTYACMQQCASVYLASLFVTGISNNLSINISVITHVCPRQTIQSRKSRWRLTRGIRN